MRPQIVPHVLQVELLVRGPKQDLHSGQFGGAVHNPAIVLAELIAGMHDAAGRITLAGFYDRVRPLDPEERAELARLPSGDAEILAQVGPLADRIMATGEAFLASKGASQ